MKRLTGKAGLVTGGANGIGRASAMALAADGGKVAVCDIAAEAGEQVAAEIRAAGGEALFIRCDVTSEDQVRAVVETVEQTWGGLDFAHNNAGLGTSGVGIEDQTMADWDFTLDVTLKSCLLGMKYQIPAMLRRGGGAIVNTASMAGQRWSPASSPAYAAAKAGVIQLSRYAANVYAERGIRVNSVSPGMTLTAIVADMFTPEQQNAIAAKGQLIGRPIRPDEIAETVLFLCSDRSSMITAMDFQVCGGAK